MPRLLHKDDKRGSESNKYCIVSLCRLEMAQPSPVTRLMGDREKVNVSSVQPRSSGKLPEQVNWSFEAGLLRFQGKYEQAEEMLLQAAQRPV